MSLPAEQAADTLTALLSGPKRTVGRTVLLSGSWGCGKTYLWNEVVARALAQRPQVYVSAFGAEDSRQFKMRLLTKLLLGSAAETVLEDGASRLGSIARSVLRRDAAASTAKAILSNILGRVDLDPLELTSLAKPDTIICIDDLERASPAFRIEELFGVTTYLAEQRHLDLVLICNDEVMTADPGRGGVYARYKEKAVFREIALKADVEALFERVVDSVVGETESRALVRSFKESVLEVFRRASAENLRDLGRVASSVEELAKAGATLDADRVRALTALLLDKASGVQRPPGFYRFEEMEVRVYQQLAKDRDNPQAARVEFLDKYLGEAKYQFDVIIGTLVETGIINGSAIRRLREPAPEPTRFEQAVARVKNAKWAWESDAYVADSVRELTACIASETQLSAMQILEALAASRQMGKAASLVLDAADVNRVRARLIERARAGDEVDVDGSGSFLFEWAPYVDDELEVFRREREEESRRRAATFIEQVVSAGRLTDLARRITNSHGVDLESYLSELSLERLFRGRERDPEGFNYLARATLEALKRNGDDSRWRAKREEIVTELRRVAADDTEQGMSRWRAKMLIPRA